MAGCDPTARIRYLFDPPQSGDILFEDDFSLAGSWDVWNDTQSIVDYNSGGLRFYVNQPNYEYWSRPKRDFQDVLIDVDSTKVSGPDDNHFGVICRYKNRENFYAFLISSDGYFGIMKVIDNQYQLISHEQMEYSEVIQQGDGAQNQIKVECNGPNLSLSVNDQKLAVAYDTDFEWGGAGLIVGTYDMVGVDILFDNFLIRQP